jgi:hypothetical protein
MEEKMVDGLVTEFWMDDGWMEGEMVDGCEWQDG